MLTPIQCDVIQGLLDIESDLPNTFTHIPTGKTYSCIPSITEFTRKLEGGGFQSDKVLTMTVRLYDILGNKIFTLEPETQEKVTHDNSVFRIISKKKDATKTHIRLVCAGTQRGQ